MMQRCALAPVVTVGPLKRDTRQAYWNIEILCPYCHRRHCHTWRETDLAPGVVWAPCDGGLYVIPSPAPRVRIPGYCDRPTKSKTRCSRRVSHYGSACDLHRGPR
jgi:hypothetical protein